MSRILKNSRILTIILVLILILALHIQSWYCFDLEKTKSISWFWYWLLTCHLDDFWYWINIVFSISRLLILILGNNFRRQVNIDFDIAWHFSSMECWYWYCRVKPDLAHPCCRGLHKYHIAYYMLCLYVSIFTPVWVQLYILNKIYIARTFTQDGQSLDH